MDERTEMNEGREGQRKDGMGWDGVGWVDRWMDGWDRWTGVWMK